MSILIKHIEVEEFTKSNNPDSIPHFVGNEVYEVAGWTIPRKKKRILLKENEMKTKDVIEELMCNENFNEEEREVIIHDFQRFGDEFSIVELVISAMQIGYDKGWGDACKKHNV